MPTDHQRMHAWAWALALPLLLMLLAAGPAGAAGSTLAAKRSQAARVMAKLDLLQTRRSAALAHERSAHTQLALARAAVASSRTEIAVDARNLEAARYGLGQALVAAYKGGGEDPVAYVLASGSFSDLVSRVDVLRRVSAADADLIAQIRRSEQTLRQQQQTLISAQAQAAAAASAADRARQQLDAAIAHSRSLLGQVDAGIRSQIAQEQARRSSLAAKHGGSSGGSGSSGDSGGPSSGNVFYGDCTWYGPGFAGHRTADGEIFDPTKLTAASPWLPFGTELKVTNISTGLSVQVRVNDRGPFGHGVLDLSAHAAQVVRLSGWQRVRIQILSAAAGAQFTL